MASSGLTRQARATDTAGAIYGTIVATAVIGGGAKYKAPGYLLALTIGTLVVFWLAHVYAEALAHHLQGSGKLSWAPVVEAMARERPMLLAPLPALVMLLLGALHVLPDGVAVNLALWAGVAQLFGWGVTYARHQHWGWPGALITGLVNGTFGVVIVFLKAHFH
jgi:hypothetical protein